MSVSETIAVERRIGMTAKAPHARRKVARFVVRPSDDTIDGRLVRTWDVYDRDLERTEAQCFATRSSARAYASGLNDDDRRDRFVDPETMTAYGDRETYDRRGEDLIGSDDDGLWWGTAHALWFLSDHRGAKIVRVSGRVFGSLHGWSGWFYGTEREAIDYAEAHSCVVEIVETWPSVSDLRIELYS